jgi:FtsP/CotA-like multicopper oxidase with cupredoxin domain
VSVRNPFSDSALTVHGLQDHDGKDSGPLVVPGGQTREVRFRANAEGTYYYWASTGARNIGERDWFEGQLTGALIVDPPNARRDDRIFVIGLFFRAADSTLAIPRPEQNVMVINGKTWPNTERFTFTQGDTVRWRWINPTTDSHPMHLHGFYYTIETRGDWNGEHRYDGDARPLVVTNLMLPGSTMRMHWIPVRVGNWVFHCHFAFHVSEHLILPRDGGAKDSHSSPAHGASPHRMSGLVLGIHVTPGAGRRTVALTSTTPVRIRLIAQMHPKRFGRITGFGYVTQEGAAEPARDSIRIPGPMLVLKRGEPVQITVVNHLSEPTAVHWHGIELESFPDGVPGWSGSPGRIMPPIAPADSFIAEFVPPRAGTFIYHTHSNEQLQMGAGLYGALLVVPPDHPYDPETDKVILVGGAGPADSLPDLQSPGLVNGSLSPPPLDLKAGRTYRLRLININPDWRVIFSLSSEDAMAKWRPVAVDGADLPVSQQKERSAWLLTGPGQTADFEFTPASPGDLRLEVKTYVPGWIIPVLVRVR